VNQKAMMADELKSFGERHGLPKSAIEELHTLFPLLGQTAIDPEDSLMLPEEASGEALELGHLRLERPLGQGAMGEVWLAHDDRLSRPVAVKLLGHALQHDTGAIARFFDEARATAQLAHPGIVPVHEVGRWEDGRPFYTMDVIRGETLTAQITALHEDLSPDALHRLVARFKAVCDAVGYAHSRGVVHRDLKPDNVMVGAFGQVLVADWGLVRADQEVAEPVHTERSADQTVGMAGTPRFMSPEQVTGDPVGPPSDVFSLGGILVKILDGQYAFPQRATPAVLVAVARGEARIPTTGPEPLRQIAAKALSRKPEDRYETASALGEAIGRWLDGAERRARALAEVTEGQALRSQIDTLGATAQRLRGDSETALADVAKWMPIERKVEAWRLEDEATALEAQVRDLQKRRIEHFEAALSHEHTLPEALALLAEHHRAQVVRAEAHGDTEAAQVGVRQLQRYDRGAYTAFLAGTAKLSLQTEPPGATVTCRPYVMVDRVMQPGEPQVLGQTPLHEVVLPMGEYELTLEAPDHAPVCYPVFLEREQHWDGGIEGHPAVPISLPGPDDLGPDDCYVPAGPCWQGATNVSFTAPDRHRLWVDGFVIQRFPVTNRQYLRFLDDLLHTEGAESALRYVPRERSSNPNEPGPPCYGLDPDRGFFLAVDNEGDSWDPEYPVLLVDWHSARAYAAWWAAQTGQPWRLPTATEWQKAARGPAGRDHPWGGPADPAFFCCRESHAGRPLPVVVRSFPTDSSVSGVRGLAGNVQDWCADVAGNQGEHRPIKGGTWFFAAPAAHSATQYFLVPHRRGDTLGFRLARSV